MLPHPFLGVCFHWLGGLASGSFYVPYRGVKKWSWETYWLVGGVFSWLIVPWLLAGCMTHDLFGVLRQQSAATLWWTYFFGTLWGLGGLTFGLTMRYLGMSLGMGVALGYCAVFGTLLPPALKSLVRASRSRKRCGRSPPLPPARSPSPGWACVFSGLRSRPSPD